jgi:hypothetical protein
MAWASSSSVRSNGARCRLWMRCPRSSQHHGWSPAARSASRRTVTQRATAVTASRRVGSTPASTPATIEGAAARASPACAQSCSTSDTRGSAATDGSR